MTNEVERITHDKLPPDLVDNQGKVDIDRLRELCDNEPRLLLDPCIDDPQKHLHFVNNGAIVAADTPEEQRMPMGHNSIKVFGLHRPQLVNDRATELVKIHADIEFLKDLAELLNSDPNNVPLQTAISKATKKLEVHCQPEQRYSGMAKQMVDRFKKELLGDN